MKKILVFGVTENPGGVESLIMNYYREIDKTKIQFDFLCNTEVVAYEEEIVSLGGRVFRIPARRNGRKKFVDALDRFMKSNAKNYAAIWMNVCSLANIDYLKSAKKYGIPKRIIHCHNADNGDSYLRGLLHKMNRKVVRKYATDFWTCSDQAVDWFFGADIRKLSTYQLIHNAIDVKKYSFNEEIRKEYRKKIGLEDKKVIGHIGRFHFQKNHTYLIDVFQMTLKKEPSACLLLIGQGELMEEMKEKVKKMGLEKQVLFLGVRQDIDQLYQAMDCFVLPSVFEGVPLVGVEAQAAGLPCIFSDCITKELSIGKNIKFISLSEKQLWVKEILKAFCTARVDNDNALREKGYNIKTEVRKIEKLFL